MLGKGSRLRCRQQSVEHGRLGGGWRICEDLGGLRPARYDVGRRFTPPDEGCIVVSIGIGGSWDFEDAMAQRGCEVHAFDPTMEYHKRHLLHVRDKPGMRFYFLGLGAASGANATTGLSGGYGTILHRLRPLDELISLSLAGRLRKAIDVLKIDCEGCEWDAFADLERRTPILLARVQHLLLELHVTPRYGMTHVTKLETLMGHVIARHDFRLFRVPHKSRGFAYARNETPSVLVEAGLDPIACCYEMHFTKREYPVAVQTHGAWLAQVEPAYDEDNARRGWPVWRKPDRSGMRSRKDNIL